MAQRGRKPTATVVKLVTGNPGRRPLPKGEPMPTGRLTPPTTLSGRPLALWRRYISKAWWLASPDGPKAWLWCQLQAQAENDPAAFTAAKIAQLRAIGSELGFDPGSRARLGADKQPPGGRSDPADRFFR
jgi:hypothetical protein